MSKGELQIRIEGMAGNVARGFAIAAIRQQLEAERKVARPCPDYTAFLEEMLEQVASCQNGYDVLRLPCAQILGWTQADE